MRLLRYRQLLISALLLFSAYNIACVIADHRAFSFSFAPATASMNQKGGTLEGMVYWENEENAIPGAEIILLNPHNERINAVSNIDGIFSIKNIPQSSEWTMVVRAAGFRVVSLPQVPIKDGVVTKIKVKLMGSPEGQNVT